jgi:glycosyltransferase involved in cell wall biosynthesis
LRRAQAFVFAAEEDFGIAPVEAQACGTPVLALGRGGTLETVRDFVTDAEAPTGILFSEATAEQIRDAVALFRQNAECFRAATCREHAARFSQERFRQEILEIVCNTTTAANRSGELITSF